jgi:hypothetical protein
MSYVIDNGFEFEEWVCYENNPYSPALILTGKIWIDWVWVEVWVPILKDRIGAGN